jgi:hypothetical protein
MSMGGRRFGLGLAVGFLLSLAIVVAAGVVAQGTISGGLSSGFKTPGSSTSSATVATTTPSLSFGVVGATTSVVSTNQTQAINNLNAQTTGTKNIFGASSSVPSFSSNLASAAQLPALSRALLLAPLVVAAILGAALYRASRSAKDDLETE